MTPSSWPSGSAARKRATLGRWPRPSRTEPWTSTALAALDDDAVDAALTALPGIGPWTSTIYRLMVLLRPDAWPVHDIALAQALAEFRGACRPGRDAAEMVALAEAWRPWRAVAARILWHHYLSTPRRRPGAG